MTTAIATSDDITGILQAWSRGEDGALDALITEVEPELRRAAQFYFQREDGNHTLQPTAIVSELTLRLMGWPSTNWDTRKQFFAFAGKLIRLILIDHANHKKRAKRPGKVTMVSLTGATDRATETDIDSAVLLDLDRALERLREVDPKAAEVVDLKFFAGLTGEEIAQVLGWSRAKVTRRWTAAKMFLARELGDDVERSLPPD